MVKHSLKTRMQMDKHNNTNHAGLSWLMCGIRAKER